MTAEPPLPASRKPRPPTLAWIVFLWTTLSSPVLAATDATPPAVGGPELLRVFERLDPSVIGLIVLGALIIVLLLARIRSMIRREKQPVVVPTRRRGAPTGDATDHVTMSGTTDWGFDQNKRAAQSRSAVPVADQSAGLASLDKAATMWSRSEVQSAAAISLQANDSMGKSPNLRASPYTTSHNPYFRADATATPMMEVVEVADTLLQAELLVQLGDPKQAMILLSQHIRDTEHPGPAVWLMLLGLYQATGRKSQYEALALGFKTLFNAAVPAWATSEDKRARDLESYPQVMTKLQTGWPQPAMRPLLEGLLNDDRGGSRQGFSLTAYREILFLLEVLEVLDQMTQEGMDRERIQQKLDAPA